jgi:hypothetical protein
MKSIVAWGALGLLVLSQAAVAPHRPRVEVGPDIPVTNDPARLSVEAHLAVHPTNSRHLVAAAIEYGGASKIGAIAVHLSTDGGATWQRRSLPGNSEGVDPWLAFDRSGVLYLVHLDPESRGLLWRSPDGGSTWGRSLTLPPGGAGPYDYPKILIDAEGNKSRLVILATQAGLPLDDARKVHSVVLLTSTDGREFTRRVLTPSDVTHQNGVPAVLTTGRVVAPFHELDHGRRPLHSPRLWAKVVDGSGTDAPPSLVTEQYIADSPFLLADTTSAAFRDRVYAGWMGLAGEFHHYVAHSTDGGLRWSKPVRINDSSEAKRLATHHPMLAVNGNGVLGLTWYDARDDAAGKCFRLYFSASLDGGKTFLPNVPVSSAPSCPDTAANHMPVSPLEKMSVRRRFKEGGDYHGFVALPDGSFQALWSDSREGFYQLRTARIRVQPD